MPRCPEAGRRQDPGDAQAAAKPIPTPSTALAPQRRCPRSPSRGRGPSNTFTEGEQCQEMFFSLPARSRGGEGGAAIVLFGFFFSFSLLYSSRSVISTEQPFHLRGARAAPVTTGRLKSGFATASVQPNFSYEGCLGGMCRRPCPVPPRVPGEVSVWAQGCAHASLHGHVCPSLWFCLGLCLDPLRLSPEELPRAGPSAHASSAGSGWFVHKRGRA